MYNMFYTVSGKGLVSREKCSSLLSERRAIFPRVWSSVPMINISNLLHIIYYNAVSDLDYIVLFSIRAVNGLV